VRLTGKSYAHPLVVLVAKERAIKTNHLRVGVAAGKTVGNAVERNRTKRLLREAIRPLLPSLGSGWNLILIARPALASATLAEARSALTNVLQRAKLLPVVNES